MHWGGTWCCDKTAYRTMPTTRLDTFFPVAQISTRVEYLHQQPKSKNRFGSLLVNAFPAKPKMNLRQPFLKLGSQIRNSRRFSDQISLPAGASSASSVPVTDPSYSTYITDQSNSITTSPLHFQDTNRPVASSASSPPSAQHESLSYEQSGLNLPSPVVQPTGPPPVHVNPFHTHVFFTALEKTFPSPVARTLMAATRGLLVDRILRIRRESLINKDLDNVRQRPHFPAVSQCLIASISIPCCPLRTENRIYNAHS